MKRLSEILVLGSNDKLYFHCPGCDVSHDISINPERQPHWSWNGDITKPTFTPSILVHYTYGEEQKEYVCHSYVTDGSIQYLSDCTHEYAGKTVPLPLVNVVFVPNDPNIGNSL